MSNPPRIPFAHRALFFSLLAASAGACGGGGGWWERDSPDDMMEVVDDGGILDTWEHLCECTGVADGVEMAPTTEPVRLCADARPTDFARQLHCGQVATHKTRHYGTDGDGGAGTFVTYTCVPAASEPEVISEDDCATPGLDFSGVSSSLEDGSAYRADSSAMSWGNPAADREAHVVLTRNRLSAKFLKWRTAHPEATGSMHVSGGQCEIGETCEIVLDGLDLDVADFAFVRPSLARDIQVRGARITNRRRWVGVKLANGRYEFPNARVQLSARVDGDPEVVVFDAPEPVRGRIFTDSAGDEYFTVEMSLRGERLEVDINARFLVVAGSPTADVTRTRRCWGATCYTYHDASGSRRFDGGAGGLRYEWYDARGTLVSRSSQVRARETYRYPLQLRVFDRADNRFDIAKAYTPFISIPSIPGPISLPKTPRLPSFP